MNNEKLKVKNKKWKGGIVEEWKGGFQAMEGFHCSTVPPFHD
jgi:hypothetical protein